MKLRLAVSLVMLSAVLCGQPPRRGERPVRLASRGTHGAVGPARGQPHGAFAPPRRLPAQHGGKHYQRNRQSELHNPAYIVLDRGAAVSCTDATLFFMALSYPPIRAPKRFLFG